MKHFEMRKYLSSVFLSFLAVCAYGTSLQVPGVKPEQQVLIDGDAGEWKNNFSYDSKSRFLYAVANDSVNLFICTKVEDPALQRKIIRSGLTLWIDTTGKSKQKTGIRYPLGFKERKRESPPGERPAEKPDIKEIRSEFLKKSTDMEIKGFFFLKDYGNDFLRIASRSPSGIQGAVKFDSAGSLIYELKIPLGLLVKKQPLQDKVWGFKWVAGSFQESEHKSGGGGGMPQGQGGMPMGGSMGGGGMGGGGSGMAGARGRAAYGMRSAGAEPTIFHVKIKMR